MKWNKERAKEWLDRSHNSSLEYIKFICLYMGLEILIKGKLQLRNELVNDIKTQIQKQILDCKSQLSYFQENEIKNEYDGHRVRWKNSKSQMEILKNVKSSDAEKLIAMLDICFIIRGNIIHGHKSFNFVDDKRSAENAGVFLRYFLNFVLRCDDSLKG